MKQFEKTLFFLTLLFLPTQLGRHFWPDFSFVYSLKIDYYSPTLYFWDLLCLSLFFIWILNKPYINQKALSILLFFLLTQILSLQTSINLGAGLIKLEQLILTGFFGLYIASKDFNSLKEIFRKSLTLSLIIEGFLSFAQFLTGGSLGLWLLGERSFNLSTPDIAKFNWFGQIFLRPYATFPHPNVLAGFMVLLLPLVIYLNRFHKKYEIIIGFLSVLLTFSRAATTVLIIEGIFFLRNKRKILIVILIIIAPFLIVRFNSAFNFDNLSLIRREELMQSAIISFKKFPIFGVGLNNFISNQVNSLISGPNRFLQPVHNIVLLTLAETGVVGFLGTLGLFGFPILKLWKSKNNYLARTLFFSWLSIIFLGMFDHYFLTLPQGQRLLFLIWGLSFAVKGKSIGSIKQKRLEYLCGFI